MGYIQKLVSVHFPTDTPKAEKAQWMLVVKMVDCWLRAQNTKLNRGAIMRKDAKGELSIIRRDSREARRYAEQEEEEEPGVGEAVGEAPHESSDPNVPGPSSKGPPANIVEKEGLTKCYIP